MAESRVVVVRVEFQQSQTGLLKATSPDIDGLCLVGRDRANLIQQIPEALTMLLEAQGYKVGRVYEANQGVRTDPRDDALIWAAIPAHIAQQAMAQGDD